jgi:biopolymer transport protein ExbB/TolQ
VIQVPSIVAGGMPGWQIALIAVGAALFAAVVAVLVDRAFTTRHRTATTPA